MGLQDTVASSAGCPASPVGADCWSQCRGEAQGTRRRCGLEFQPAAASRTSRQPWEGREPPTDPGAASSWLQTHEGPRAEPVTPRHAGRRKGHGAVLSSFVLGWFLTRTQRDSKVRFKILQPLETEGGRPMRKGATLCQSSLGLL